MAATGHFGKYIPLTTASSGFSVRGLSPGDTWFATMTFELASTPAGNSGAGSAGKIFSPITLTRPAGSDADSVAAAYGRGATLKSVTIGLLNRQGQLDLTIQLSDAVVTRYAQYVQGGVLTEEISIQYDTISIKDVNGETDLSTKVS